VVNADPGTHSGRKNMANNFYAALGWSQARIDSHIKAIDCSQSVQIVEIPKEAILSQWQGPNGNQGNYFAESDIDPSKLGISPFVADQFDLNTKIPKINIKYTCSEPVLALKSTANPMVDIWSESIAGPEGENSFVMVKEVETEGGANQYFIPNNSSFL